MANITLHSDRQTSATSVSNTFIDEYMSDANGEFVKIYLYLLRQLSAPDAAFSISSMADKFEHTEKDIKRALSYWERMHLLRLEYDSEENLIGVCFLDAPSRKAASAPETAPSPSFPKERSASAPDSPKETTEKNYSAEDISNFRKQEPIAELLFIAERYLGRILTPTDMNSILYWYDGLGFSTDLIEYLIEYCVGKGHTSIRYIEKVALAWARSNITTIEQAKVSSDQNSQTYFAVMKALGITGRSLISSEISYIEKWKSVYGFSTEIITAACERTIGAIHQPKFEYIDSILTSWNQKQVVTLEDIRHLDEIHQKNRQTAPVAAVSTGGVSKNRFNNFDQRSYDYDQLEKMLLTTSVRH